MTEEIRVEYMNFEEIRKWPRNPKDHDLHEIQKSFYRFGFIKPVLVDESSGQLVAGHGRLDTLRLLKDGGKNPPRGVQVVNDETWLVPVLRGVHFENLSEAESYLLADNRLSEIGGWNNDALAAILEEMSGDNEELLDGTGFDIADVDDLIGKNYDYSDIEKQHSELTNSEEVVLTIIIPTPYKEQVNEWLRNGEKNNSFGRGLGVLNRMGIKIEDEDSTDRHSKET